MDNRHRGIGPRALRRQQQGHGPSQRRPPTYDHHPAPGDLDLVVDEHGPDPGRGAGHGTVLLEDQSTQVDRVEPVSVLGWVHRGEGGTEVEAVGDRVLDDEGVNCRILVEPGHRLVECRRGGVGGHHSVLGGQTGLLAGLVLLAHIAGASRVVADQDGS